MWKVKKCNEVKQRELSVTPKETESYNVSEKVFLSEKDKENHSKGKLMNVKKLELWKQ